MGPWQSQSAPRPGRVFHPGGWERGREGGSESGKVLASCFLLLARWSVVGGRMAIRAHWYMGIDTGAVLKSLGRIEHLGQSRVVEQVGAIIGRRGVDLRGPMVIDGPRGDVRAVVIESWALVPYEWWQR